MSELSKFVIRERYSIGQLEMPGPDDSQFASLADAEIRAVEDSIDDSVWGVWENTTGELLAIVYQQTLFRP